MLAPGDEATASTAGLRLRAALERSFEVADIRCTSTPASASPCSPSTRPTRSGCCSAPTSRCTRPSAGGPGTRSTCPRATATAARDWRSSGELHDALDAGQLVLHYQPKADLATGAVRGVEALVRWQHPQRGLLGPDHFLPLMEHSGLTRALTAFVLDRAIEEIGDLRRHGFDLSVAVNLGPADLLDLGLPSEVERLLDHRGFGPEHLELEVSEDVVMADVERTIDVLVGLRAIGVRTALDDFGAGQAALGAPEAARSRHAQDRPLVRDAARRRRARRRDRALARSTSAGGSACGSWQKAWRAQAWELLADGAATRHRATSSGGPMTASELQRWLARHRSHRGRDRRHRARRRRDRRRGAHPQPPTRTRAARVSRSRRRRRQGQGRGAGQGPGRDRPAHRGRRPVQLALPRPHQDLRRRRSRSSWSTRPSRPPPSRPTRAAAGGKGGRGHGGRGETALTGDTKTKVEAAVLAKYPGATIVRTETNGTQRAVRVAHQDQRRQGARGPR